MVDRELVRHRLVAQGLAQPSARRAHDVALHLAAAQGQDLPGVVSSIALRLGDTAGSNADGDRVAEVIRAFDEGSIVRGYPMRGTVFVMAAEDARWMTELCAGPAIRAQIARRSQLGLDEHQVHQAREVLDGEVRGAERGIGRRALMQAWEEAGLEPAGGRGYHLLTHFVQTGFAVYGVWNGTDNNVHRAAEHLPAGTSLADRFDGDRVAATAELLLRYLTGHGPASLRDFAWWTKLPLGTIRAAFPLIEDSVETVPAFDDRAGEQRYVRPGLLEEAERAGKTMDALYLLPGFDEIVLGYPDRMDLVAQEHHPRLAPGNNGVFQRSILRRGSIVGTWRRGGRPGARTLELDGFAPLPKVAHRDAARAHARFPYSTP